MVVKKYSRDSKAKFGRPHCEAGIVLRLLMIGLLFIIGLLFLCHHQYCSTNIIASTTLVVDFGGLLLMLLLILPY